MGAVISALYCCLALFLFLLYFLRRRCPGIFFLFMSSAPNAGLGFDGRPAWFGQDAHTAHHVVRRAESGRFPEGFLHSASSLLPVDFCENVGGGAFTWAFSLFSSYTYLLIYCLMIWHLLGFLAEGRNDTLIMLFVLLATSD